MWFRPSDQGRAYLLLTAPMVVFLAVFVGWPLVSVAVTSVTEPDLSLGNYARLLTDSGVHQLLLTTARISVVTTALTIIASYVVAYVMVHERGRVLQWLLLSVLLSFWLSAVIRAFAWIMLLRSNGVVNLWLLEFGLIDSPIRMMRNEFGVFIGMVHLLMPAAILLMIGNFSAIDRHLVQAAKSLGARPWQAFLFVYLPQSIPGVVGASVIVFIVSLGFFITPALLGGGKTVMVAEYISLQVLQAARWGMPAALATVMLAAVALALYVMSRLIRLHRLLIGHS